MPVPAKLSLSSPTDLLAAVPYLLGFHPADSVVILGLADNQVCFQARADLDAPADALAEQLTGLLHRQRFGTALVVGYGPPGRVDPVVTRLRARMDRSGIRAMEALRAEAGRYWSYTCRQPGCCPPEGTPYAVDTSVIAAEATVAGMVALPSRADLCRQLAPVEGPARAAMRAATERAEARAAALVDAALAEVPSRLSMRVASDLAVRAAWRRLGEAGRDAVDQALALARVGTLPDDTQAAWLSALLLHAPVRDYAWAAVAVDYTPHLALWTDLTRRAEPELRAAPATLLAFTAWQAGEGAISTIALEIALTVDPTYPAAHLLNAAITEGINPADWAARQQSPPPAPLRRRRVRRTPGFRLSG
jgi:hypothetical protein